MDVIHRTFISEQVLIYDLKYSNKKYNIYNIIKSQINKIIYSMLQMYGIMDQQPL